MNQETRVVARALFRARLVQADGQAYEDLFSSVMRLSREGFRQIRPQGAMGDRKNDGYVKNTGSYWQVYAPQDPRGKAGTATAKAINDFEGLKSYWEAIAPVKEYYFAHNDKYHGSYPELEKALAQLQEDHGLEKCEPFLAAHLEDHFMSLRVDQMNEVIGMIPSPHQITDLEFSAVGEVISEIMADTTVLEADPVLVVPDWEKKIAFNNLSPRVTDFLRVASYQIGSLDRYFRNNSRFLRSAVRSRIHDLYITAVESLDFDDDTQSGDVVYFLLLNEVAGRRERAVVNAAHVLIAYYFESCDVFEEPKR